MTAPRPSVWLHALDLVRDHGFEVFPVAAGEKRPVGGHGCLDATTDEATILAWAARYPTANFGIAGGGSRNLHAIDIDRLPARDELTARFGALPPTATAETPKPGRHEFYRLPSGVTLGNSASLLAAGVDTRGSGGYVVGAGSALADGRQYGWLRGLSPWDVPIAELPSQFIAALQRPRARTSAGRQRVRPALAVDGTQVPWGGVSNLSDVTSLGDRALRIAHYINRIPPLRDGEGRNATAYRLAAFLLNDLACSPSGARALLGMWNARNVEPMTNASLDRVFANASCYGGQL